MKDFFSDMSKLQAEQKPGKGNPKFVPTTSNQSYRISPMDYVLRDIRFTSVTFSAVFCSVGCLPKLTKNLYLFCVGSLGAGDDLEEVSSRLSSPAVARFSFAVP